MNSTRISYTTRPDTTPEAESATLSNIYSYVLSCANKNAAGVTSTNGDDAMMKGSKNDRATPSIPDR